MVTCWLVDRIVPQLNPVVAPDLQTGAPTTGSTVPVISSGPDPGTRIALLSNSPMLPSSMSMSA